MHHYLYRRPAKSTVYDVMREAYGARRPKFRQVQNRRDLTKSFILALTSSGFSTGDKWPAPPITARWDDAIARFIAWASPGGVMASRSPTMINVGRWICGRNVV